MQICRSDGSFRSGDLVELRFLREQILGAIAAAEWLTTWFRIPVMIEKPLAAIAQEGFALGGAAESATAPPWPEATRLGVSHLLQREMFGLPSYSSLGSGKQVAVP